MLSGSVREGRDEPLSATAALRHGEPGMFFLARLVGLLALVFGLFGLFATWVGQGQQFTVPVWADVGWSEEGRRVADWAAYGGMALGGLMLLAVSRWIGMLLFFLVTGLAIAKGIYDFQLAEPETARRLVILRADLILVGAAFFAFLMSCIRPRGG